MKKILLLPLFAAMALVSQAQAQTMCLYPDGGCWPNPVSECNTNWGFVFNGGTEGAGTYCSGGTYDENATEHKGRPVPEPGMTAKGCCRWATTGNCETVYTDGEATDCQGGPNTYWAGSACSASPACPTSPPTYDGQNPAEGNCCWEGNSYNNYSGYCGPIGGETTVAKCQADGGTIMASCGGCNTGSNPNPPTDPCAGANYYNYGCPGYNSNSPITVTGRSVGLTVVPSGKTLHIISGQTATVELFSMTGAKVFSSRVAAGNTPLSLEKQRQGVYYAVITSGSQKQTVKVILK